MSLIWAGMDSGKGHHHGLALDADGKTPLSRRVANDEPELLKLIGDILDLADGREVTWAIYMTGGEPALLLALLVGHGQEVLYMPGRLSTGRPTATAARARPTPVTPTSSRTRPGCAGICGPSVPATKRPSSSSC